MIVLNTEKELIRVASWDDIVTRPGFSQSLNPNEHELKSIIGRYAFSERIQCGLSTCHTPHGKGYIVTTKDGLETNIGKDCGKTYFGVDFDTLSRSFDQDVTDKENRDKLWSFLFAADEFKSKVSGMRLQARGANWIHKTSRDLLEVGRSVPDPIVRRVESMIRSRNPALMGAREATDEEVASQEAREGRRVNRPHYVEHVIAFISGLEALYPENNLRDLLVVDLETNLKAFERSSIDIMTSAELSHWSKWISSTDATLDRATLSIDYGRRLLVRENLAAFSEILTTSDERRRFNQYLRFVADGGADA